MYFLCPVVTHLILFISNSEILDFKIKRSFKEQFNTYLNLDWGKVEFYFLGIAFNVNLNVMPEIKLGNIVEKLP